MQICPPEVLKSVPQKSVVEAKYKIRLNHDECCNCCCCSFPQPTCYKYVQPEVPKSFAPLRCYWQSNIPVEDKTTYKLSYWEGSRTSTKPCQPKNCLTVHDGQLSDETTHRMSYLGNWCVKPESPMIPCSRQLFERGPIQNLTTQKHDFSRKNIVHTRPFPERPNLYRACASMADDTTYRLSYYNSTCRKPIKLYKPIRKYFKSNVPMDDCTTYNLSFWPNQVPVKENHPWNLKLQYYPPVTQMDGCTTYKLSYWPHKEKMRDPIRQRDAENLLNVSPCFNDDTTYKLSYFGCGGNKSEPIRPSENISLSPCPLTYDTVNRMSYLGNWCFKPESSIIPCSRDLLSRGPIQDITTQNHDYTWKYEVPNSEIRPKPNLAFSSSPLECCTTQQLSYMSNNFKSLIPTKSYAPVRRYCKSDVPLDAETTMRLSYQPVQCTVEKPCNNKISYHPPVTSMEDNTTYNMSYISPGVLVPLKPPSSPCLASNNCNQVASSAPCVKTMPRPFIACGSS